MGLNVYCEEFKIQPAHSKCCEYSEDEGFTAAAKEAAEKAVTCGVEINTECGNYAITLQKGSRGDSQKVLREQDEFLPRPLVLNIL